jgi:hypothetical protein
MQTDALHEQQQSEPRPPGSWKLEGHRALTLVPREDGLLRVARGRVWATFDGPHPPLGVRGGDLVVDAGETLFVAAGERLVMEPARRDQDVFFHWDPLPQVQAVPVERWRAVVVPWRELRTALSATAVAASHLAGAIGAAGLASLPRRLPSPRIAA